VHVVMMGLQLLIPGQQGGLAFAKLAAPVLILYPIGFLLLAEVYLLGLRRKQQEGRLAAAEQRFRTLVEGAPDAIFVLIGDRLAYLNPAAVEQFGAKSSGELLGTSMLDRLPESLRPQFAADLEELEQPFTVFGPMEVTHVRIDGSTLPVEVRALPAEYEGQRAVIVFSRDISDRIELENKYIQAQKMEAVGRLAGGVAHDFNNMLQTILGYSDLLLEGVSGADPQREPLLYIQSAAERSAALTRQLLAFARKQSVSPQVIDLNPHIADLLKMLGRLIGEDIELIWGPCRDSCRVWMDPSQLDQALTNLVINARDAVEAGGWIRISTQSVGASELPLGSELADGSANLERSYACVQVADNGSGMDEATAERAFEPFFTTKSRDKGTGLGLATVFGVIRQCGGLLDLQTREGEGTVLSFYLPIEQERDAEQGLSGRSNKAPRGHERILFVEDEPSVLQLGTTILRQLGYEVFSAASPSEALMLASGRGAGMDALVTDVVMPENSGPWLWSELKRTRPELPCLFLSGYSDDALPEDLERSPQADFISKPYSAMELGTKLRALLDRVASASGSSRRS
jgi:two-component system cell cycle sensor histidine kinase/response regulator CckA